MRLKVLVVTGIVGLAVLAVISAAALQDAQPSGATQSSPAGAKKTAGGETSMTGCVAKEGDGFVLKTENGTYEFNTVRDLSSFVGKKVRIVERWNATGVTTTAPIKAAAASTQMTQDEKKAGATKAFVGDLHLHITGDVVGSCEQSK
jgi:ABC-type phosphate transport system substrate-binding protein